MGNLFLKEPDVSCEVRQSTYESLAIHRWLLSMEQALWCEDDEEVMIIVV
jgi:hypothetical protein